VRYLEYIPQAPLSAFVRRLWYCADYKPGHKRERLLPNGTLSVVICLAHDRFSYWRAGKTQGPPESKPASVIAGVYSAFSVVETSTMDEMVGVQFRPGGARTFFGAPVDEFTNQDTPLEDDWGLRSIELRERLLEAASPEGKLGVLESELRGRLRTAEGARGEISFALEAFHAVPHIATVAEITRQTGLSHRRFAQIFRQELGVTPKLYCRIRRFQQAIRQIQMGHDVRWSEVALDCGYFDQAHFVNEFRSFSGITPTTYRAGSTTWSNHVALDA
jgi:AraC-like DNA-binding protein